MKVIITEFVRACSVGQHIKPDRSGEQGLLHPLKLPTRKRQSILLDWVLGVLEIIRNGLIFNAILVATDRTTRMVHLIPTSKNKKG